MYATTSVMALSSGNDVTIARICAPYVSRESAPRNPSRKFFSCVARYQSERAASAGPGAR